MKINRLLVNFIIILLMPCTLFAATSKPTVNILTWWGYLDDPKITNYIQNKCNVKVSYDEYYSNQEFLERWKEQRQNYDVIIFSDIAYGTVKNQIALKNSNLHDLADNYPEFIKKHYIQSNFPNNVVYFTLSVMGFLWNPQVINLTNNDNMLDVFEKAKSNNIILIDDPAEVNNVMQLAFRFHETRDTQNIPLLLNTSNMDKLTQASRVYITNDYSKIYSSKDFAFSYLWSGDAFYDMKEGKYKYNFMTDKKLSYICSDLIAQINPKPEAVCVAHVLAGHEVLNMIQNSDYYFSPYGDSNQIKDPAFMTFYKRLFSEMPYLSWIEPVPTNDFGKMEQEWRWVKLKHNEKDTQS